MSSLFGNGNGGSGIQFSSGPLDFQPSERERAFRDWLLRDVLGTHAYQDFSSWLKDKLVIDGLEVPISQVTGFSGFTFQTAEVGDSEATTSTSYTDLTTPGPQLTGLPDGSYAIFYGCTVSAAAGELAFSSISINGAAASANDEILATLHAASYFFTPTRLVTKTLTGGGGNSIRMKYRTNGGVSVTFQRRWLSVVKYANL